MLICIFFVPIQSSNNIINTDGLIWPTPGYTKINSYYGKRNSPTKGASTYHKGIDIGAPEGSNFVAVTDGTITFKDFLGGGGYTITLTDSDGIKYSYCHCNPNFIVSVGEKVSKGDIIRKCWS